MHSEPCPTCGTLLASGHHPALQPCAACLRQNPVGFVYCGFCAAPIATTEPDDVSRRARERTDVYPTPPLPQPTVPIVNAVAGSFRTSDATVVAAGEIVRPLGTDAPRHHAPQRSSTVAVRELQAPSPWKTTATVAVQQLQPPAPWREPDAPEPAADPRQPTARIRPKGIDESMERSRKGRVAKNRSASERAFGANVLSRYGR